MPYLRLLRPEQWVKNVFLFAGLVFGRKFTDADSVLMAIGGFSLFCLLSSAVYVLNDLRDREDDKLHPRKRTRPIASGAVSVSAAMAIAAVLLTFTLGSAAALDRGFFF